MRMTLVSLGWSDDNDNRESAFLTLEPGFQNSRDINRMEWLTSWQYCSTPSLVPTQLLVPEGSGSQRPVWMLTCMLSFPQNMATCGSATANPVPTLAASACRRTQRKEVQWVVVKLIKSGKCSLWQARVTACLGCVFHKHLCVLWNHEAHSGDVQR